MAAPVANNDFNNTDENAVVTTNVVANDTDSDTPSQRPFTVSAFNAFGRAPNSNGVSLSADGMSIVFDPNQYVQDDGTTGFDFLAPNEFRTIRIDYRVRDSAGEESTTFASLFITVTGSNEPPMNMPPVAVDDNFTNVPANQSTTFTRDQIVGNDVDPDADPLFIAGVGNPVGGTVVRNEDGSVTFTAAQGFTGTASFDYSVTDLRSGSDQGTVTLQIVDSGTVPVANDDSLQGRANESQRIETATLLANDTDADGDQLFVTGVANPVGGTVSRNPDGSVQFTPTPGFVGTASFDYSISDFQDGSDAATAQINFVANSNPVAVDDSFSGTEDQPIRITSAQLTGNDTDANGDTLFENGIGNLMNVTVSRNSDGSLTFTPTQDFVGVATFDYNVSDGRGGSDIGTGSINFAPVQDQAPVANDDGPFEVDGPQARTFQQSELLANDTDEFGDTLRIANVANPQGGTVVLNQDGTITFTPAPGFTGAGSFDYLLTDDRGGFDQGFVALDIDANDPPVARDDTVQGRENQSITIPASVLTENDFDPEGDPLNVVGAANASNGTVVRNADGSVTFTPTQGFRGVATFDYTVNDGRFGNDQGQVSVVVNNETGAPIAVDDRVATPEDTPLRIQAETLTANDRDPNGDPLRILSVANAQGGSVVLNEDGSVTFTPAPNFTGTGSFDYLVNDGRGGSDQGQVLVDVAMVNDTPVANPDRITTDEATTVTGNVLANDTDPDGPALMVSQVNGAAANVGQQIRLPSGALLTVNSDGTFSYNPNGSFDSLNAPGSGNSNTQAQDSFTYMVRGGNTTTATVTINGLAGSSSTLNGTPGNDIITGSEGNDTFRVEQGGSDSVRGLGGDDVFFFGNAFDNQDSVNGGTGNDELVLQGFYNDGRVTNVDISSVETLTLLSGSDTRFGSNPNSRPSYNVSTSDSNVPAGTTLNVNAASLLVSENVVFNGSRESDGNFIINTGAGNDQITGGSGNDVINTGAGFDTIIMNVATAGADTVNTGSNQDNVFVNGTGQVRLTFLSAGVGNDNPFDPADGGLNVRFQAETAGTPAGPISRFDDEGIRFIAQSGLTFDVRDTGGAARGEAFTVVELGTAGNDSLFAFNSTPFYLNAGGGDDQLFGNGGNDFLVGGAGNDRLTGQLGSDTLIGGGGADVFVYRFVDDSLPDLAATSTSAAVLRADRILDFQRGVDDIDLSQIDANRTNGSGTDSFRFIGSGAFTAQGAGSAGELRSFTNAAGQQQVEGDTNGDGISDITIFVTTTDNGPLNADDFILTPQFVFTNASPAADLQMMAPNDFIV